MMDTQTQTQTGSPNPIESILRSTTRCQYECPLSFMCSQSITCSVTNPVYRRD